MEKDKEKISENKETAANNSTDLAKEKNDKSKEKKVFSDRVPGKGLRGKDGRRRFDKFKRGAKPKPEFDQKIVDIRRVVRVVAGGRRFSFSVALVAGNRKGSVGVGLGKASDTALAIEKAFRDAQKNKINIKLTSDFSIPHKVRGKICGSSVLIMPAPGRGILAGSSVRDVMDLAGIKNINAKILSRSKNKLNNAKAAIKALSQITANNSQSTKPPNQKSQ